MILYRHNDFTSNNTHLSILRVNFGNGKSRKCIPTAYILCSRAYCSNTAIIMVTSLRTSCYKVHLNIIPCARLYFQLKPYTRALSA